MKTLVKKKLTQLFSVVKKALPQKNNHKMSALFLFSIIVFVGIVLYTEPIYAQGNIASIGDYIGTLITRIFLGMSQFFIKMSLFFLQYFIAIAGWNNYIDVPTVMLGWTMVRDVANMFFVVILLAIAFGTILGVEQYQWNKLLIKLILSAVFINFSNLICGIFIDAAHVFTITFVNAVSATAGGNFIQIFKLEKLSSLVFGPNSDNPGDFSMHLLVGAFASLIFAIMAMCIIAAYAIVMLARMVVLWILIILSPLAFILQVLPGTQSYAKQWWDKFMKQVLVAPVMVFFLWLTFATAGGGNIAEDIGLAGGVGLPLNIESGESNLSAVTSGSTVNTASLSEATTWGSMASFFIPLGLLMAGIGVVQQMGVVGGGVVQSAQGVAKKIAGYATGYNAARWTGGKVKEGAIKGAKLAAYHVPLLGGKQWVRRGTLAWRATKRWGRGMDDKDSTGLMKAAKMAVSPVQVVSKWFAERGAQQEKALRVSEKVDEDQKAYLSKRATSYKHGARARDLKGRLAVYEERSQIREKKESAKSFVDEAKKERYQHRYISYVDKATGKRVPYKLAVLFGLTRGELRTEQGTTAENIAEHRVGAVFHEERKKEMDAAAERKVEKEGAEEMDTLLEAKERLEHSEMSEEEIALEKHIKEQGEMIEVAETELSQDVRIEHDKVLEEEGFTDRRQVLIDKKNKVSEGFEEYRSSHLFANAQEDSRVVELGGDKKVLAKDKGDLVAQIAGLKVKKQVGVLDSAGLEELDKAEADLVKKEAEIKEKETEGQEAFISALRAQSGGEDLIEKNQGFKDLGKEVEKEENELEADIEANPEVKKVKEELQGRRTEIEEAAERLGGHIKEKGSLAKQRVKTQTPEEKAEYENKTVLLEEGEKALRKKLLGQDIEKKEINSIIEGLKVKLRADSVVTPEMEAGKVVMTVDDKPMERGKFRWNGLSSLAGQRSRQERVTERETSKLEEEKAQIKQKVLGLDAIGNIFSDTVASELGKTAAESFIDQIKQRKTAGIFSEGVKDMKKAFAKAAREGTKVQDVKLNNSGAQAAQAQYLAEYFKNLTDLEQKRATDEMDDKFSEGRLGFSTPASAYKSLVKRRMDETFQGVEREQAVSMALGSLAHLVGADRRGETLESDQTAQMMANTQYLVSQAWHDDLLDHLVRKIDDFSAGKITDSKEKEEAANLKEIFVDQLGWGNINKTTGELQIVNRSGADRANDLQRIQAAAGDVGLVQSENAVLKVADATGKGYSDSADYIEKKMRDSNLLKADGSFRLEGEPLNDALVNLGREIGVTGKTAANELRAFSETVLRDASSKGTSASQEFKGKMGQYQESMEILSDFKHISMGVGHIDDAGHTFYDVKEKMFRGQLHKDATAFMLGDWNKVDARKKATVLKTHTITQMDEEHGTASHWNKDAYATTFAGWTNERLVEQLEDRNVRHLTFRSSTEDVQRDQNGSYLIGHQDAELVKNTMVKGQNIVDSDGNVDIEKAQVMALKDIARNLGIGLKHDSSVLVSLLGKMTGLKWDESVNHGELNLMMGQGSKYEKKIDNVAELVHWVNWVRGGDKETYDKDTEDYMPEGDDREYFELSLTDIASTLEKLGLVPPKPKKKEDGSEDVGSGSDDEGDDKGGKKKGKKKGKK